MPFEDASTNRMVQREISRRYVDATQLNVHVTHGVVHVGGILRPLSTHLGIDLKQEMETITHILRTKPEIRDVIWEATIRT